MFVDSWDFRHCGSAENVFPIILYISWQKVCVYRALRLVIVTPFIEEDLVPADVVSVLSALLQTATIGCFGEGIVASLLNMKTIVDIVGLSAAKLHVLEENPQVLMCLQSPRPCRCSMIPIPGNCGIWFNCKSLNQWWLLCESSCFNTK